MLRVAQARPAALLDGERQLRVGKRAVAVEQHAVHGAAVAESIGVDTLARSELFLDGQLLAQHLGAVHQVHRVHHGVHHVAHLALLALDGQVLVGVLLEQMLDALVGW